MHTERILLVGAGGHGKVALDALLQSGVLSARICIADSNAELQGQDFLGFSISMLAFQSNVINSYFHVAIGNGDLRRRVYLELEIWGNQPLTIMHPNAVVSRFSSIGPGGFIAAHAVVGPAANIGRGVIINHGAIVDHDCVIGSFCHIAPNVTLGGGVQLGAQVLIGAGANVLPGVHIGDGAIIGAGAVVLNDVGAGDTWVGVPAIRIPRS